MKIFTSILFGYLFCFVLFCFVLFVCLFVCFFFFTLFLDIDECSSNDNEQMNVSRVALIVQIRKDPTNAPVSLGISGMALNAKVCYTLLP